MTFTEKAKAFNHLVIAWQSDTEKVRVKFQEQVRICQQLPVEHPQLELEIGILHEVSHLLKFKLNNPPKYK
jgi:hypothetical protein